MLHPHFLINSALFAAIALFAGCSCNDEYGFTSLEVDGDFDANFGRWLQMDVSPDGRPVATYYDDVNGGLRFSIGTVADDGLIGWVHEDVDGMPDETGYDAGDVGSYTSMVVADNGSVWVSYYNVSSTGLKVAHRVGGVWTVESVDAGGNSSSNAGLWSSIALNADGNPVVAHYDGGSGDLRMSRFDGSSWSSEAVHSGADFSDKTITREADVGKYAKLLIDGNTEYIAFYDAAWQRLDLLEGFVGAYALSTVYSNSDAGMWPSMLVDNGTLYLSFQDLEGERLMLATRKAGSSFSLETVDQGRMRGSDSELFMMNGDLQMVYFDGHNNDMMLATPGPQNSWQVSSLGGDDAAVGFHNEVVALPEGYFVASFDHTNQRLFSAFLP